MALANIYRVTQDVAGNVVTDVLGTVTISGTSTLAALFSDAAGTVPLPNPVVNNSTYGSYSLFVAAGTYDMQFVKAGFTFETQRNITLRDPAAGVNTITGTANRVLVTPPSGIGAVTLSTPQNLDPDANIQFGRLGLGTPAPTLPTCLQVNGGVLADSPTLVVDSVNHRVGIGQPTPAYKLEVAGQVHVGSEMGIGTPPDPGYSLIVGFRSFFRQNVGIGNVNPDPYMLRVNGTTFLGGVTEVTQTVQVDGESTLTGNVGIGQAFDPTMRLVVAAGNSLFRGNLGIGNVVPTQTLDVNGMSYLRGSVGMGEAGDPGLRLVVAAGNSLFRGNLGIGNVIPSYTLQVNGNAAKTGGGTWTDPASSRLLKRNIRPLVGALASLLALHGRQWEWAADRPDLEAQLPGTQTGFVIEEVQEVRPAWILSQEDGTTALNIRGFEALCVEAFREVAAWLAALETALGGGGATSG